MLYLDTHIVIWLFDGRLDLLPLKAKEILEAEQNLISPICVLELQYLFESGKIGNEPTTILAELEARMGLEICHEPFEKVISVSIRETWTRDPFDRIIVGQAKLRSAQLLTKDQVILESYSRAVWE